MEKNARLYVVFQGLITLVEYTDRYVAYVVHDEDDVHRGAFGHWLCETSLPCAIDSALLLNMGVPFSEEGARLDCNRTLILDKAVTPDFPQPPEMACDTRIFLPRPDKIHYYCGTSADESYFIDPSKFRAGSDGRYHYSVFRMFEYRLTAKQLEKSALTDGHTEIWTPQPYYAGRHLVDVLHLFAEPETADDVSLGHGAREFTNTCALLGLKDDVLRAELPMPKQTTAEGDRLPDGLVWQEIIPVIDRDRTVTRLITHWLRSGTRRDETDNWGIPASHFTPYQSGTTSYCGGPDGGGGDYGEDLPKLLRAAVAEWAKEADEEGGAA